MNYKKLFQSEISDKNEKKIYRALYKELTNNKSLPIDAYYYACKNNTYPFILQFIIDTQTDIYDKQYLSIAIKYECYNAITILLKRRLSPEIIEQILLPKLKANDKIKIYSTEMVDGQSLEQAIKIGNFEIIKLLFKQNLIVSMFKFEYSYCTKQNTHLSPYLMEYAAGYGHKDVLEFLIENDAPISERVLDQAIINNRTETVQFLIEKNFPKSKQIDHYIALVDHSIQSLFIQNICPFVEPTNIINKDDVINAIKEGNYEFFIINKEECLKIIDKKIIEDMFLLNESTLILYLIDIDVITDLKVISHLVQVYQNYTVGKYLYDIHIDILYPGTSKFHPNMLLNFEHFEYLDLFKFNASIGNIKLSDLLEEYKEWIITSKHLDFINEMRLNNIKFTKDDILTALETKDDNTIALICTFLME